MPDGRKLLQKRQMRHRCSNRQAFAFSDARRVDGDDLPLVDVDDALARLSAQTPLAPPLARPPARAFRVTACGGLTPEM